VKLCRKTQVFGIKVIIKSLSISLSTQFTQFHSAFVKKSESSEIIVRIVKNENREKSRKTLNPGPPAYSYTLYSTKVAENARSGTSRKSAKTKTKTVHYHSDKGKTPITFEPVNGFSISQVLRSAYCKGYRPVWSNHSLFTVHILHFVLTDIKQRYCAYRDHRTLVCLLVTRPAYFRHKSVSSIGLKR
jgi:hypothetical protein